MARPTFLVDNAAMRCLAFPLVLVSLASACRSDSMGGEGSRGTEADTEAGTTAAPANEFVGLRFEDVDAEGGWGMVTDARFIPGTDELIVLEKSGRVGHLRLEEGAFELLGSFTLGDAYSVLDCGLISLAIDPAFETNRFIYIGMCVSEQSSEIHRYTFDTSNYAATPSSKSVIIHVGDPDAPQPWHNIGSMGFEPDGTLWALFGDKKVDDNGQDVSNPLAALLRLVPNRDEDGEGATAPEGNAFQPDEGDPLIYAYGLRSPWKGVRDSEGRVWVGDVGANGAEEINVVTDVGQNFGWSNAEGPCEQGCDDLVDPVAFWEHQGVSQYAAEDPDVVPTNARVAYVALEVTPMADDPYRGALDGSVLFGDYCQGWVRGATLGADGTLARDVHLGHLAVPSAWMRGSDGFVYAATFGKCETPSIDEDDPPASRFVRAVPVFE